MFAGKALGGRPDELSPVRPPQGGHILPRIPFQPKSSTPATPPESPSQPVMAPPPSSAPESGQAAAGLSAEMAPEGGARGIVSFVGSQLVAAGKMLVQTRQQVSEALNTGLHALRGDVRSWSPPGHGIPPDKGGLKL